MKFTLGKQERLKRKKLIEKLYAEGKSIKIFPLRMVYLQATHTSKFPSQCGFSVSKKKFKKAVDRNRIKRLLRETYRLNKYQVYDNLSAPYVFMISYIGNDEKSYHEIDKVMKKLLIKFIETINLNEDE